MLEGWKQLHVGGVDGTTSRTSSSTDDAVAAETLGVAGRQQEERVAWIMSHTKSAIGADDEGLDRGEVRPGTKTSKSMVDKHLC